MQQFAPSARLAPFVERFTVLESDVEVTRALLPELAPILGVRFAGAASLVTGERATRVPDAAFTGVQGSVRHMRTHAGGGIVLAFFRPGGAAACFRAPLHELFDATLALDALVGRADAARLADRVASTRDPVARCAAVDAALVARLTADARDPLIGAAVDAITAAHGTLRIAELAERLDVGQDAFEKRFRRAVGTAPKQLATLARVKRAISLAQAGGSLARIAQAAGYFDQPHFNRDFRAVTGTSPTQFFRTGAYC